MNKIDALKKTLHVLENDLVKYFWACSKTCNCGILAQCVMNKELSIGEIYKNSPSIYSIQAKGGPWTKMASVCEQTGIPLNNVFKALFEVGFTTKEIQQFEFLSDESIYKFPFLPSYGIKSNVILYLKAWIQKLESEQIVEPVVKTEYKVVEVDSKVKELVKQQLILS
jgi:hypothetical protein